MQNDLGSALDAYLTPFVERLDFSGIIMVSRADEVLATKAYGFANYEFGIPHTVTTRYWAGSISKMFTLAAIVALEKAGRLDRSDPLSRYLPAYPGGAAITLRQLVDHTAGIARDLPLGSDRTEPHTTEEIVAMVARIPSIAAPGEAEAYSNNGYRILARVLEVAGGGDFADIVRATVFEPLGMNDTLMPDLRDVVPLMASGYVAGPGYGTLRHAAYYNVVNEPGAGAFYSTPSDLLTFARSLPIEAAEPAASGAEPGWVGHNGLGNGFAAYCYRFPDHDMCLVMMANIETGLFGRLNADLRRMMLGLSAPAPEPPPAATVLDATRAHVYVGDYDLFPGVPLSVRPGPHGLEAAAGDAFHPLVPIGGDDFFMRLKYARIAFDVVDGESRSATWSQDGTEFSLPRLRT
ncbi:MAG TPA: serine hydrolase domain-containing protein [Micromonosporaceae bacterium]|jgi:CubicO group peptidase (beta-lactamase class C family)